MQTVKFKLSAQMLM